MSHQQAATPPPPPPPPQKTYLIIGASRGIGLAFTAQLLSQGQRVLATARAAHGASQLWTLTGTANGGNLSILECDVTDEGSVARFVDEVGAMRKGGNGMALRTGHDGMAVGGTGEGIGKNGIERLDCVVVNAGVLKYPNRVMDVSFKDFTHHMITNTVGPLLVARSLLKLSPALPIHTLVFMSSDSGSAANFRAFEDGFAAYAASKAALNQGLRHLAAELDRVGIDTKVLAMHPGEVQTDMANVELSWEVEGIISPEESVRGMLRVIEEHGGDVTMERRVGKRESGEYDSKGKAKRAVSRGAKGEATFWTWEGNRYPW